MTQNASDRDIRPSQQSTARTIPAFKAVALPAAVQAAKLQRSRPKTSELPAILRKEAMLG
ncbi:hypothetical protein BB934_05495 [Microvirga ossetica]|uniref:Uncharacterized protein n=1 Tax=Microvirga ossetica TaxID=1882682 RepID=A0A1B2ECQ9_9HYPH|nr:hypothetical protein [Microvirga ossetica]ANY77755.1 hypothetical protein BB934_05495 [Microvirga ossetica]